MNDKYTDFPFKYKKFDKFLHWNEEDLLPRWLRNSINKEKSDVDIKTFTAIRRKKEVLVANVYIDRPFLDKTGLAIVVKNNQDWLMVYATYLEMRIATDSIYNANKSWVGEILKGVDEINKHHEEK